MAQPNLLRRVVQHHGKADQALAPDTGLPGRPWYRNLVYAPGHLTGYSTKTLPGILEAIEDQRWSDASRYIRLTAAALDSCAGRLDAGKRLMTRAATASVH